MKNLFFILSISTLFLFNSCDNETPSTVSGGGRIKFEFSISPALKSGDGFFAQSAYGTTQNITAGYSGETSQEAAVTKGQNFPLTVSILNSISLECKTITIKAILNGSVFDTKVLELGVKNLSTGETCKDGQGKSLNYIIP